MENSLKKLVLLISLALIGVLTGFLASSIPGDESGYCQEIEQQFRSNESLDGVVACYPPSAGNDETGEIENKTEAECICQRARGNIVENFVIRRSR
jgi:hypothetical protein